MHSREIIDLVKQKSLDSLSYARIEENLHSPKRIVEDMVKTTCTISRKGICVALTQRYSVETILPILRKRKRKLLLRNC